MKGHVEKAGEFLKNEARADWHDESLWFVRQKRDKIVFGIPEWEALRELASQIKDNVLSNLDHYLIQFEQKALKNGVQVHWAADGEEHNRIVYHILQKCNAKRVVKSKSMLTEECHLNDFLVKKDIEVIDTDLGERIIQLNEEPPSHIVLPAIHLKKEEIGELFHRKLNTEEGITDPRILTEAARQHLRNKFLKADAALTGVNFAVAETGGVVVCTNEGNADMGVNMAPVQIHSMGIEKIIPEVMHLGVFTRLLARNATGQPITVYTSHYHRPRENQEMHIVIVDNGRSKHLGKSDFRDGLKCIRCGACLNTCPIYRRSGGHSYGATIPGPIGSILSPAIDMNKHKDLAFASTLCGSCDDVCPVKINISEQLYRWRQIITEEGSLPKGKHLGMKAAAWVFAHPAFYHLLGKMARQALKIMPRWMVYNKWNLWGRERELPVPPKQSFKEWFSENKNNE